MCPSERYNIGGLVGDINTVLVIAAIIIVIIMTTWLLLNIVAPSPMSIMCQYGRGDGG